MPFRGSVYVFPVTSSLPNRDHNTASQGHDLHHDGSMFLTLFLQEEGMGTGTHARRNFRPGTVHNDDPGSLALYKLPDDLRLDSDSDMAHPGLTRSLQHTSARFTMHPNSGSARDDRTHPDTHSCYFRGINMDSDITFFCGRIVSVRLLSADYFLAVH